ncbi:hypothetical protein MKX01_022642 [Papaver californicum]|nr:hypothetical protein MKX01_022642 [Papaver californicum]
MSSSSSSSFPLLLQSSKNRAFSSSRATNNKPEFVSFHQKLNYNNNVDISHSISLQFKPAISSVSCKSSSSESSFFPRSEAVQVKFQLIRECLFGQEFLVVGDDPIFGVWDPSSAIPLKWSQGHLWTAELDVPIDKTIQFKFILKDPVTGKVIWQPGPNRVFQTWETNNTIVVFEDWNTVGLQMISEEEPLANSNTSEDVIAGNSNADDTMPNSCTLEPLANSNTKESVVACPISSVEKLSHPEEEQTDAGDDVTSTAGSFATEKKSTSLRDEDTLFKCEAEPVRLPRSNTLPIITVKEGLPPRLKSSNNVKRTAAESESKSKANDIEVATEDDNKSENYKKEEPGKSTSQQEATRRMSDEHKPDEDQVGVGDEKDCQSTNAESTEVLDFPSAEDADILKEELKLGDSVSHNLLKGLGFSIDNMDALE